MTHLSLFAGIGGFDCGFELAGFETVAQVESDPHCQTVLAHHWPEVPRYDDIREFDGADFRGVDVITGGFPCQDLSVAGRREGLSGDRSGLFFEMCRVVAEARPRLLLWENVPGLLSADGGGAMATVLGELADIGYSGCWRVLDSQWFGVPQRRRRVFGAFAPGGAGGWACGAAVLLEPEGGGWHPAAGGQAGEDVARDVGHSLKASGGYKGDDTHETYVPDVSHACDTSDRKVSQREGQTTLVANSLRAADGHHGHSSPRGDGCDNLVADTLQAGYARNYNAEDQGTHRLVVVEDMGRKMSGDERVGIGAREGGPMYTLQADARHGVAGALTQTDGGPSPERAAANQYIVHHGVRRLTPTECERLQGFPDSWTDVDGMSDTQRYRQLGNAVTVNVAFWLGLRAKMALREGRP